MNRVWIAALALVLMLTFSPAVRAEDMPHIATANPGKIFNEMQETKDLKEQLDATSKELGNQLNAQEQTLKGLQDRLKQLAPGTQQYNDTRKELIQKAVELDTWKKVSQAQLQDQQKYQMKSLFDKITEATRSVAMTQKLDIVFTETNVDFPDMDQINVDQLRALINQRNILFSSGKYDISAQVTAKLDADYKSRGMAPPTPPTPAPTTPPTGTGTGTGNK